MEVSKVDGSPEQRFQRNGDNVRRVSRDSLAVICVATVFNVTLVLNGVAFAQDVVENVDPVTTAIPDFSIDSIEVLNSEFSLDDRFEVGKTASDVIHRINKADCEMYNMEGVEDVSTTTDVGECGLSQTDNPTITVRWSGSPDAFYTVWSAKIGTCSKEKLGTTSDTCTLLTDVESLSDKPYEFNIPLAAILGTARLENGVSTSRGCCSAVTPLSNTTRVYIYVSESDSNDVDVVTVPVEFAYDYDPPEIPSSVTVAAAGETIEVSWSKLTEEEDNIAEYQVYYSTTPFSSRSEVPSDNFETEGGAKSSTTLKGLEVGVTYYVSVGVRDIFDNLSELSANAEAVPIETRDGFEAYKDAGGGEDGGFCFVATAAYGSYMHPHVSVLRDFRDSVLMPTDIGAAFVDYYYSHGVYWAELIRGHDSLRSLVRVMLLPWVMFAYVVVKFGVFGLMLLAFALSYGYRAVRRLASQHFGAPKLYVELSRRTTR